MFKKALLLSAAATSLLASTASALPVTYGFYRITNNSTSNVASQLTMDVDTTVAGFVDFTFRNDVGVASSIADVYFDDGSLLGISAILSSPGVAFAAPATPGNLPGGNALDPDFETGTSVLGAGQFSADSDSPVASNGVNASTEWLTIRFRLIHGQTVGDTIAALNSGSLRVGLHVQAQGTDGQSDSYVNRVPDGGSMAILLGAALLGLGGIRRMMK